MNCPNCNANEIINGRCQYCGTFFPEQQSYQEIVIPVSVDLDKMIEQVKFFGSVL